MEGLTSIIVSGIVWDAIKKGVSITTGYLKKKLSGWILDDAALDEIKEYVCNIPEAYLVSEGMIKEYMNLSERMLSIFENAQSSSGIHINQNVAYSDGLIIGNVPGTLNINNYNNMEPPRLTQEKSLSIIGDQSQFSNVQVVESFSDSRKKCFIDGEKEVVYADICIPEEIKKREGCVFSMIQFPFIPSENWMNYYDENYKMKFIMETSSSIKKVRLQIKDTHQHQFWDEDTYSGKFVLKLSEMAPKKAWKDIFEICFTVFASDDYIEGEKGFIQIKGFRLEQ